jgi:hypothetical protein
VSTTESEIIQECLLGRLLAHQQIDRGIDLCELVDLANLCIDTDDASAGIELFNTYQKLANVVSEAVKAEKPIQWIDLDEFDVILLFIGTQNEVIELIDSLDDK